MFDLNALELTEPINSRIVGNSETGNQARS